MQLQGYLLSFFSLFASPLLAQGQSDCSKYPRDHTLCKYYAGYPGYDCTLYGQPTVFNRPLPPKWKKLIVDAHNKLRSDVAMGRTKLPQAGNMRKIKWHNGLAKVSQRWADQCKHSHDCGWPGDCRKMTKHSVTGQNVYWQTNYTTDNKRPNFTPQDAVDSWYAEIQYVSPHYVDSFPNYHSGGVITHFTQLIHAETGLVGCGIVEHPGQPYYSGSYTFKGFSFLVVCDYAEGGNEIGKPIYLRGSPASNCPKKTTPDSQTGLCA